MLDVMALSLMLSQDEQTTRICFIFMHAMCEVMREGERMTAFL